MSDTFADGTTDWHNWMRDTMKIDPSDSKSIALVWAVIGRIEADKLDAKRRRAEKRNAKK